MIWEDFVGKGAITKLLFSGEKKQLNCYFLFISESLVFSRVPDIEQLLK